MYKVTKNTKINDMVNETSKVLDIFFENIKGVNTKWFKIVDITTNQYWCYINGDFQ